MSRIETVNPAQATGKAKELLDGVKSKLGMTPNLMRVMANSPAVLDAYLKFSGTLGGGDLPAKTREQIALAVGQANSCDYCLSAHSAIGKMVGLSVDQILDSRRGSSSEPTTNAVLRFARQLVDKRGLVSDADLAAVRSAGLDDGEIAEIVANVALNIFTNYVNHVAETEIDFPRAEALVVTRFRNGTRTKRNVALLPTNTGVKAASKRTLDKPAHTPPFCNQQIPAKEPNHGTTN